MYRVLVLTFLALLLIGQVQAQDTSCFSAPGALAANIQVSFAVKVNEPVLFSAANSTGVGSFFKEPIEWDFGDGFKAKMCRATHVYRNAGSYVVTLKVKDNQGNQSIAATTVVVSGIPNAAGNNILTVVTNGSGNGTTTFNTIQAAVNKAATINSSGPVEIILPAGAVFTENIELKVPVGNNYITLRSSALGNLPEGIRVNRSNLGHFATIKSTSPSNSPIVSTELRSPVGASCTTSETCLPAHHYRLQGIQFKVDPGTLPNGIYEQLVAFGTDESVQNEASEQAHHLIMDRCLVYREDYSAGNPNAQSVKNGLEANARNISIIDSDFTGINAPGIESHGVTAYNSTGMWGIVNNYFEAGSINFFTGGAFPSIPGAVISDVEFIRNRCHKPLEKRNLPFENRWSAKNNFELKSARYWVIQENLFDGNWIGSNQFYLVNLNALANDTGPQATLQDIQFSRNVVKQGQGGLLIGRVASDFPNAPFPARFLLSDNLFTELGGPAYGYPGCTPQVDCDTLGRGFSISTVPFDLMINHNTFLVKNGIMNVSGDSFQPMLFQNNIMNHGENGIKGDGSGIGCSTIDNSLPDCNNIVSGTIEYFPGSVLARNVIANVFYDFRFPNNTPYPFQSNNFYYPSQTPENPTGYANINNHFVNRPAGNYRIANGTPGKNAATDGTDVGANIDTIDTVNVNAVTGNWTSGSPQSAYPGPNPPNFLTTIEAENFDRGGQGIAYNDVAGSTSSGAYRSNPVESVDILANANASNGFTVFEAAAGEWLEYTVNVPAAGLYNFGVRYSSGYAQAYSQGQFKIEVCEPTAAGGVVSCVSSQTIRVNSTGAWSSFKTVNAPLYLTTAGTRVLRLIMVTNAPGDTNCNCVVANFDAVTITGQRTRFDYDNDRKADVSLFRPAAGAWYAQQSTNGFYGISFGVASDVIAPADFDGDGKTDVAVFRPSNGGWYIFNSSNSTTTSVSFGANDDVPVQADYDGDGKADIAVWRPSDGGWYRLNSFDNSFFGAVFGLSGDKPAVGDYDGDGKSDLAVFRPATGEWHLQQSVAGISSIQFGLNSDKITPADFDGDGKTDIAVFRPANGAWYRLNSSDNQFVGFQLGVSGDAPAPADFDGDGKADQAVFRPSTGAWYIQQSTAGYTAVNFGLNGDIPAPSTYVR